jgi:hypothetical protein
VPHLHARAIERSKWLPSTALMLPFVTLLDDVTGLQLLVCDSFAVWLVDSLLPRVAAGDFLECCLVGFANRSPRKTAGRYQRSVATCRVRLPSILPNAHAELISGLNDFAGMQLSVFLLTHCLVLPSETACKPPPLRLHETL